MTDKTMTLDGVVILLSSHIEQGDTMRVSEQRMVLDAVIRHLSQPAERGEAVATITGDDVSDLKGIVRTLDNLSKKRAPDPKDLDADSFVTANINHAVKSAVYWLPIAKRIYANAYNALRDARLKVATAPPPAAGVPDGWRGVLADAINYIKSPPVGHDDGMLCLALIERADELLSATPSPTIDVAAVRSRNADALLSETWGLLSNESIDWVDAKNGSLLERIAIHLSIGDAK